MVRVQLKERCFCAQCLFSLWNCLHEISIKAKFGSNNTKDKSTWLDLDISECFNVIS